jgi:hypothetical protein
MNLRSALYGAIIVLVIIIIAMLWVVKRGIDVFLRHARGYWICDPSFAESAEVGTMLMFIADKSGYLIIDEDVNTKFSIKYGIGRLSADLATYSVPINIDFEDDCAIPNKMTLEISIVDARLRLIGRDDEGEKTIYGVFWKEPEISYMYR